MHFFQKLLIDGNSNKNLFLTAAILNMSTIFILFYTLIILYAVFMTENNDASWWTQ